MPTQYWEKISHKGDFYHDLYKKFWKKPLEFEQIFVGSESFNVLMIHASLLNPQGKLIVHQEYLNALISLEKHCASYPQSGGVVIGHSGIGKSWFHYFLLVLRLSRGQKTILCLDPADGILLFNESGCYVFQGTNTTQLRMSSLADNAWALLDSPNPSIPPSRILTSRQAPVFLVFSSSPNDDRYMHLEEQNNALIHVMENWSFSEIWAGAMLYHQPNPGEQDLLQGYYWKYGPSARKLFGLYNGTETPADMDDAINAALNCINLDKLKHLLNIATGETATFGQRKISHSVILAYPHPERRNKVLGQIISYHVFQLLANKLFIKGFDNIVKTYQLFHGIDPLSVSFGWIFTYYCHHMLSEHEGRQISLIPMTKTCPIDCEGMPSKLCYPDNFQPPSLFTITRRRRHHFNNGDKLELSNEDYFIPSQTDKPIYDGFMNVDQSTFAFQMTTKKEHRDDVKPSGIDNLRTYIGSDTPLTFILLVPKESKGGITVLTVPEEVWWKAQFFMSVVEVRASPTL